MWILQADGTEVVYWVIAYLQHLIKQRIIGVQLAELQLIDKQPNLV